MRKTVRQVGACLLAGVLSGCGSLYNAANDRAAHSAGKAYDLAGLGQALDAERAALAQQQTERHALVIRSQLALRDRALVLILDEPRAALSWNRLEQQLSARIASIAGSAEGVLDQQHCPMVAPPAPGQTLDHRLRLAHTSLQQEADSMQAARSNLAMALATHTTPPALSCEQAGALRIDPQATEAALLADHYRGACERLNKAKACIASAFSGGALQTLTRTLSGLTEAKAVMAADVGTRRHAYTQLLNAADSGAPPGNPAQLAARLTDALDALENTASLTVAKLPQPLLARLGESGRLAALKEKRALLDAHIQALAGVGAPGASRSAHRLALVASLLDKAGAQGAPTAGILMEAEFVRQQIGAVEARMQRAAQAEQIIRRQQDHLLAELGWLLDARGALATAPRDCRDKPLQASLSASSAACASAVSKALVAFSAAWTAGRIPVEQDDYRLIDLGEQAALEESATALAQTDAVIRTALGQIAALHASGIKPEDIAALAQALSLPAIAARLK